MGRKATHIPQKYRFDKLQDTFQERKIQDLIKHNSNNRIVIQTIIVFVIKTLDQI